MDRPSIITRIEAADLPATTYRTARRLLDLVGDDGKVAARPVTLAGSRDGRWIVTAGLADGEQVIVEGLQKVRVGASVDAEPVKTASATPAER